MNLPRLVLAALGAFVVYFAVGAVFFTLPGARTEFAKFPAVYRSQEGIKRTMPLGMLGMLLSMFALAVLFVKVHPAGGGVGAGAEFGFLVALYALGSFVLHNYNNLNISGRLSAFQALAYSVEWVVVGIVLSLIYRA